MPAPMPVPPSRPRSLVVTVAGLEPGAPLDAAVRLADALDARRVPLTLLAGARPHPEVVAWATARRRAGDGVLLHGAGGAGRPVAQRGMSRLPGHEAGLRLAGALRARDAAGLEVDGFAAPGWTVSSGVRTALAAAGVDLLVDDVGVHRLGEDGSARTSVAGGVDEPGTHARTAGRRRPRRHARSLLRHHATTVGDGRVEQLLGAVDADLAAGAVPDTAPGLLAPRRPVVRGRDLGDPEFWSITA